MRRAQALAAVAVGFGVLAAAGCGVQPTGVNIAQTEPFEPGTTSSSQSAPPSQGSYVVQLYLFPRLIKAPGTMVVRSVVSAVTPLTLPSLLATDSGYSQDDQFTSYVPAGITVRPTQNAHEYVLTSPTPLGLLAEQQLYCTFDQYWLTHKDPANPLNPSTKFIGDGLNTVWQDCPDGVIPVDTPTGQTTAKPSTPEPGRTYTTQG